MAKQKYDARMDFDDQVRAMNKIKVLNISKKKEKTKAALKDFYHPFEPPSPSIPHGG
jgi:hypothetical protein